ncbi:hypothetical protein ABE10_01660, partial [Bacillus toyonensis]|nr:hypothetical protein [Bacillus toyonensis]
LDPRVVLLRPGLGEVERVEAVRFRLLVRHDLNVDVPLREVARCDRVEEVATVVVGVGAGQTLGLVREDRLDALLGEEVVFHPEALARGVDPLIGVRAVAVDVT